MVGWWGDFRNQLGVIKTNLECQYLLFFAFNHRALHLCICIFEKKSLWLGSCILLLFHVILFSTEYHRVRGRGVFRMICIPSSRPLETNGISIISAFMASYLERGTHASESRWVSPNMRWEQETSVGLTNPENTNKGKNPKAHRCGRYVKIKVLTLL